MKTLITIAAGIWYYESARDLHIVYAHEDGQINIYLPWSKIIRSGRRCKPKAFVGAKSARKKQSRGL